MLHLLGGGDEGGVDGRFALVVGGDFIGFGEGADAGFAFLGLGTFAEATP